MRHGEAENNVMHIFSDAMNAYPLTAHGRTWAGRAAAVLRSYGVTHIYTSPVRRARETAHIVGKIVGARVHVVHGLREVRFGRRYANKPVKEFEKAYPSFLKRFHDAPPGGETYTVIQKRMLLSILQIDRKHRDARILIVSHGDPLWLLESGLAGYSRTKAVERRYRMYHRKGELRAVEPYTSQFRFRSLANGRK